MIDLDGLHVEVAADGLVVPHALGVLVGLEVRIGFAEIEDLVAGLEMFNAVGENVVVAGTAESVSFVELSFVVDDQIDDGLELRHANSLRDRDGAVARPFRVAEEATVGPVLETAIVEVESCTRLGFDVVVPDIHS